MVNAVKCQGEYWQVCELQLLGKFCSNHLYSRYSSKLHRLYSSKLLSAAAFLCNRVKPNSIFLHLISCDQDLSKTVWLQYTLRIESFQFCTDVWGEEKSQKAQPCRCELCVSQWALGDAQGNGQPDGSSCRMSLVKVEWGLDSLPSEQLPSHRLVKALWALAIAFQVCVEFGAFLAFLLKGNIPGSRVLLDTSSGVTGSLVASHMVLKAGELAASQYFFI